MLLLAASCTLWPAAPAALAQDTVRCKLSPQVRVEGDVEFLLHMPSSEPDTVTFGMLRAVVGEGYVDLPERPDSLHFGKLTIPGYLPTVVDWGEAPDRCVVDELVPAGSITGFVRPAQGKINVRGCGGFDSVPESGAFYIEGDVTEPCDVTAERQDGLFSTYSEPVTVHPDRAHDTIVELRLPTSRTAGMGVRVAEADDGLIVERVRTGSGAHAAGLEAGDLITTVDGQPTAGMGTGDMSAVSVGEEGTFVDLSVRRVQGDVELTVERVFLDDGHDLVDIYCGDKVCGMKREERPDAWVD